MTRRNLKRVEAAEWLTKYLAEHGPTCPTRLVVFAAQRSISARTLEAAAQDMGVTWDLPDNVKQLLGYRVKS